MRKRYFWKISTSLRLFRFMLPPILGSDPRQQWEVTIKPIRSRTFRSSYGTQFSVSTSPTSPGNFNPPPPTNRVHGLSTKLKPKTAKQQQSICASMYKVLDFKQFASHRFSASTPTKSVIKLTTTRRPFPTPSNPALLAHTLFPILTWNRVARRISWSLVGSPIDWFTSMLIFSSMLITPDNLI